MAVKAYVVTPCSLVSSYQHLFEMLVTTYSTMWCQNPEGALMLYVGEQVCSPH
jgi:hypothetical protein